MESNMRAVEDGETGLKRMVGRVKGWGELLLAFSFVFVNVGLAYSISEWSEENVSVGSGFLIIGAANFCIGLLAYSFSNIGDGRLCCEGRAAKRQGSVEMLDPEKEIGLVFGPVTVFVHGARASSTTWEAQTAKILRLGSVDFVLVVEKSRFYFNGNELRVDRASRERARTGRAFRTKSLPIIHIMKSTNAIMTFATDNPNAWERAIDKCNEDVILTQTNPSTREITPMENTVQRRASNDSDATFVLVPENADNCSVATYESSTMASETNSGETQSSLLPELELLGSTVDRSSDLTSNQTTQGFKAFPPPIMSHSFDASTPTSYRPTGSFSTVQSAPFRFDQSLDALGRRARWSRSNDLSHDLEEREDGEHPIDNMESEHETDLKDQDQREGPRPKAHKFHLDPEDFFNTKRHILQARLDESLRRQAEEHARESAEQFHEKASDSDEEDDFDAHDGDAEDDASDESVEDEDGSDPEDTTEGFLSASSKSAEEEEFRSTSSGESLDGNR